MAQLLTPITAFTGRGQGEEDLQAALVAASDTTLQFENTGKELLFINNGDASPKTATLQGGTNRFSATPAAPITIPAGETGFFSFCNQEMYNVGGLVTVELSDVTSVTVGLYQFLNTLV
jgi:hypothetical protein